MRILLLNQFYPPDPAPTGRVLHDLGQALVKRGHEVAAITSQSSYRGENRYPSRQILDGISIVRLAAPSKLGRLPSYISYLFGLLNLELMHRHADIVVSMTSPPYLAVVGGYLARRVGAVHCRWVMDAYPDALIANGSIAPGSPAGKCFATLARYEADHSSRTICIGPGMARSFQKYEAKGTKAYDWVPLWAEEGLFPLSETERSAGRRSRNWRPDDLILLYSGNMGRGHRFKEFLGAAGQFGQSGPLWVFSGEGNRRLEIEHFRRNHHEARIELRPFVRAGELREHLGSADIHLVSLDARWTGVMIPSKIQGTFAMGIPSIFVGSPTSEISQWIRESGAGWTVQEDDIDGLVRAVKEASDPKARAIRGGAALEFSRRQFDKRTNTERIAELLEHAARDDRGRVYGSVARHGQTPVLRAPRSRSSSG